MSKPKENSKKLCIFRAFVRSIDLDNVKETESLTRAFQMWVFRRILRIFWVNHVNNIEVLRRMKWQPKIIKTVKTHNTLGTSWKMEKDIVFYKISFRKKFKVKDTLAGEEFHSWQINDLELPFILAWSSILTLRSGCKARDDRAHSTLKEVQWQKGKTSR